MIFNYTAIDHVGQNKQGTIETTSIDVAVASLQKRGLVVSSIKPAVEAGGIFGTQFHIGSGVSNKDIVILSRQMATLFTAQVSALSIFQLLAAESENPILRVHLTEIVEDIQGGSSMSKALEKHPKIFSSFYIGMIKAGEESGRLDEAFTFLADYLDRTYEVTMKARNALIYPAFIIFTFIAVMVLMLTIVIPKISVLLVESGQAIPIYTRIVLAISNFFLNYGILMAIILVFGGVFVWRWRKTTTGKLAFANLKLEIPYVGDLYKKLYLSRISDNMSTMVASGIPILRALEITSAVVGNEIYEAVILDTLNAVKGGSSLSKALGAHPEIPHIVTQMIKVGEETGETGNILKTLAKFYQREVISAVDTLVDLIEPVMIVLLGVGVGILLASVLIPIYNVAGGIS